MAAARVDELPSRCSLKRIKKVDVYKTNAKIIIFAFLETRWLGAPSIALKSARTPTVASSVWSPRVDFVSFCVSFSVSVLKFVLFVCLVVLTFDEFYIS